MAPSFVMKGTPFFSAECERCTAYSAPSGPLSYYFTGSEIFARSLKCRLGRTGAHAVVPRSGVVRP